MRTDVTYMGRATRVIGAKVIVEISSELPSTTPIIDGRVHRIGQIGSFVRFPLGFLNVFGIVSTVGADAAIQSEVDTALRAERTLEVQLVGEAMGGGSFQRGVSQYPSIDDEVHLVTEADLGRVYGTAETEGRVVVGHHSMSESLPASVDLGRLITRHSAVLGSTGSGKSNTVSALLRAFASGAYPSANVLVIDPHGEYGSALEGKSRVFRIGDFAHDLVLPYWALSFDELAWFLVDRRNATETQQDSRLRELIYEARRASIDAQPSGCTITPDDVTPDSPIPFDLHQIWYNLDRAERLTWRDTARTTPALIAEGNPQTLSPASFEPAGAGNTLPHKNIPVPPMGAYVNRIITRLKDRRYSFMLAPGEYDGTERDLHDLVATWTNHEHGVTVLDLAGVPSEITDLVVGLVTRLLFETMFWGRDLTGLGRQRPLLVVYEEAHSYLPRGDSQFLQGWARRSVQRLLKEGRKYGVGAMIVSQRPSEIDETILSQCGTFFALRLTNSQDQGRVAAMMPDEVAALTNLLPALRTGEALVVGEAVPMPSRVRVDLVTPRPDSSDPDVVSAWTRTREEEPQYEQAVLNWRRQQKAAAPQP